MAEKRVKVVVMGGPNPSDIHIADADTGEVFENIRAMSLHFAAGEPTRVVAEFVEGFGGGHITADLEVATPRTGRDERGRSFVDAEDLADFIEKNGAPRPDGSLSVAFSRELLSKWKTNFAPPRGGDKEN